MTPGQVDASGQPVQVASLARLGCCADHSAGGCEYCCGNESGDPHQSAHQREDEPRGRPVRLARWSSRWSAITISVVIPKGTPVSGVVVASHRRGHFKGSSILELRLTSLTLNGTRYPLDTHDLTQTKKGKGKRSAAFIGGGAGLGMLIGGVATGGVGLLVGGLAGAGAGTALGGLTGNRDIEIPAESIVRFKLADNLVVQPA